MKLYQLVFMILLPLLAECQEGMDAATSGSGEVSASTTAPTAEPSPPLDRIIDSLRLDASSIRFRVDKSERIFEVYVDGAVRKTYPCVLGEKPVGDKFCQGDRRTPEGTFGLRSKRLHAAWHKFIWVDYPNAESYRRFKERKAQGLIPAGKDIGGEIGIHGVPDGMDHWIDAGQDWTWGCIALKNSHVDEIYPYIQAGRTTLEVVP